MAQQRSDAIDWSVIEDLRRDGADQEIIDLYVEEATALLARIRAAVEHGDAGELRKAAHALKGSSNDLGVRTVAALSSELDQHARRGVGGGVVVTPLVRRLEVEVDRALKELREGSQAS
jgi:HPt (histidine-containing phosphotransfer) domain-containing protein